MGDSFVGILPCEVINEHKYFAKTMYFAKMLCFNCRRLCQKINIWRYEMFEWFGNLEEGENKNFLIVLK